MPKLDLSFLPDQPKVDLSFLPDKPQKKADLSFLPDKPVDLSFLPDQNKKLSFFDRTAEKIGGMFADKPVAPPSPFGFMGPTGAPSAPPPPIPTPKDFIEPIKEIWKTAKVPAEKAREGGNILVNALQKLGGAESEFKDVITPDYKLRFWSNFARDLGTEPLRILFDFASVHVEPEVFVGSGLLKAGLKIPFVRNLLTKNIPFLEKTIVGSIPKEGVDKVIGKAMAPGEFEKIIKDLPKDKKEWLFRTMVEKGDPIVAIRTERPFVQKIRDIMGLKQIIPEVSGAMPPETVGMRYPEPAKPAIPKLGGQVSPAPKPPVEPVSPVSQPVSVPEISKPHKIVGIDADSGVPIVKMGVEPGPAQPPAIPVKPRPVQPPGIIPPPTPQAPPSVAPVEAGRAIPPVQAPLPPEPVKTPVPAQKQGISIEDSKLMINEPELTGIIGKQKDLEIGAWYDGKPVGYVSYSDYQGTPKIKYIEVKPEYQKKGIGQKLVAAVQKEYPNEKIEWGMTTPSGTKLRESVEMQKPSAQPNIPLEQEALKYKTAEEFVRAQTPSDKYITVYHRTNATPTEIDKGFISRENTKEIFVSNQKTGQAVGYGKNIIKLRVKKSDLRLDDEFASGEKHFALNSALADRYIKTKSQLTDIWKKSRGWETKPIKPITHDIVATPLKQPEPWESRVTVPPISKMTQNEVPGFESILPTKQVKPEILKHTGVKSDIAKKTITEDILLRKQIQDESRGAKAGYKEGVIVTKEYLTEKFRQGTQRQSEIISYIKNNLPTDEAGKYLNAAKQAQDSVKKMYGIIRRVDLAKEKIDRKSLVGELKKLTRPSTGMTVDYQKQIAEIMEGIDLVNPTMQTVLKLRKLRDYIKENGAPMGLAQERIDNLERLTKKPVGTMTTDELKELRDNVKSLKALGELKKELKYKYNERERQAGVNRLLNSSRNIDPKKTGDLTKDKIRHEIKQTYMNTIQPPRVAQMIDGYKDGENYNLTKRLWGKELEAKIDTSDDMTRIMEEINAIKSEWTEKERTDLVILLHIDQGAMEQAQNIISAYGYTSIPEKTAQQSEIIDIIRKNIDKYDKIAPIYEEMESQILEKVDNYFPLKYEKEYNVAPKDLISRQTFRKTGTFRGFTFARQEKVKRMPRVDLFGIIEECINEQNWYLKVQPELENIKHLVFDEAYIDKAGVLAGEFWRDYLDVIARRGWSASATASAILRQGRLNMNNAILGYKLSTILMQPFAIFDALAYTQARHGFGMSSQVFKEFGKAWINPAYAQRLKDSSIALKERMGGEIALEEVYQQAKGKKLKGAIQRGGMAAIRWSDITTAAGVQKGIEKALIKQGIPNAQREAEFMMNLAQGSSDVTMRPLVLSKGELARLWFTFQTFFLNRWGIIIHDLANSKILGGKVFDVKRLLTRLNGLYALGILVAGYVAEQQARRMLYKVSTGKELKGKHSVLGDTMMSVPSQVPYFGNVFESAISGRTYDPPLIRTVDNVFKGTVQAAKGEPKGVVRTAEGIASILGVPGTAQAFDIAERIMPWGKPTETEQALKEARKLRNEAKKKAAESMNPPWYKRAFGSSERSIFR